MENHACYFVDHMKISFTNYNRLLKRMVSHKTSWLMSSVEIMRNNSGATKPVFPPVYINPPYAEWWFNIPRVIRLFIVIHGDEPYLQIRSSRTQQKLKHIKT